METCQSDYSLSFPPPPHTHPIDSQVLRPDGSKSCLFWTHVCPMQDVMAFFAHHCPSLLQDLHVAGAYFSQGIWWCYFSQLFQFRNHHLPKSSALGLFPMVWCEDPRWFQPSSSPAVTHNIYSYFVLRQANNLGGRTTELIITQGLIGMRCIAYIEINHVVIFFFFVV